MPTPVAGEKLQLPEGQGTGRRPSLSSTTPRQSSASAAQPPASEKKPEVERVKVLRERAETDEDDEAAAQDMNLVQLLIAVSNFTKHDASEVAARKCEIRGGTFNAHPAFRLLRIIKSVVAERRRQFVHYRLQALVFQFKKPAAAAFQLPEGMGTPRSVIHVGTRTAWWKHASNHSNVLRKEGIIQGAGRASAAGKQVNSKARQSDRQAAGQQEAPRSRLREKRNSMLTKSNEFCSLTGDVALASKDAAAAAGAASPHRGTIAKKRGRASALYANIPVPAKNDEDSPLEDETSSAQSKATSKPKSKPTSPTGLSSSGRQANKRASTLKNAALSVAEIYPKDTEGDDQEEHAVDEEQVQTLPEPDPQTTPSPEESQELSEEGSRTEQREARRSALANIIMDAAGGCIGKAGDCPMGARHLIKTSPDDTPPSTPRDELADAPYARGSIAGLTVAAPSPDDSPRGQGSQRPSSAGAIGHLAEQQPSSASQGGRRPSSASGIERPSPAARRVPRSSTTMELGSGHQGVRPGSEHAHYADLPSLTSGSAGHQADQLRTANAGETGTTKLQKQVSLSAVSTRAPSSAASPQQFSSAGNRRNMKTTASSLRKFEKFADNSLRFNVVRGVTGLRQQEPWMMSKPGMTAKALKEWDWTPEKALAAKGLDRPSSAPELARARKNSASRSILQGRFRPNTDESEKSFPASAWGAEVEQNYLPVPSRSSKSMPTPSRQQKLDKRVDSLLGDVGYNLNSVRQGLLLRNQVRAEFSPKDHSALHGASAPGATMAHERPPKVTKVVTEFGERPSAEKTGCRTATHVYLQETADRRRAPAIPKCLQITAAEDDGAAKEELEDAGAHEGHQLNISHANIGDDEAIPMLMGLRHHTASFNLFDLSGNPRLTDSTYLALFRQLAELACESGIQYLDLSGAKGMGEGSLLLVSKCMHGPLGKLKVLRMDGIAVAEHVWPTLEEGMQSLIYLQELSLADMHIGRQSQRSAHSVADILLGLPNLQSLNVSSNYFGLEGCKHLAENMGRNRTLVRLDLSYNAGGFVAMANSGKTSATNGTGRKGFQKDFPNMLDAANNPCIYQRCPAFNPISLICEGLASSRSLKELNLSSCQLTYDEDFVLEDAIAEKAGAGVEELDLAGNPCQGPMGARCLLRLSINAVTLHRLDVCEFREALPAAASIPYEPADPSVHYDVDLSHPQHRALLRTLLRRCRKSGEDPRRMFEWKKEDQKLGETIIVDSNNGNGLPTVGCVSFGCRTGSHIPSENVDISGLIDKLGLKRKLKVSLWGFTRVAELFKNLKDEESRRVLLGAMASDLLLKLCHVRVLSEMDTKLRLEVVQYLLPAVHALDRMGGFDIIFSARGPAAAAPLQVSYRSTLALLMFNPYCPNGHYEIGLSVPADRRILEQLLVINEWERARAQAMNHADLSQHGCHECLRNVKINGIAIKYNSEEVAIPPRGEMLFDYCTPFHVTSDEEPSSDEVVQLVEHALLNSVCSPWLKVSALRTILHKLVLLPEQFADLVKVVPAAEHLPNYEPGQITLSPRVEAFIMLYPFCMDLESVVSSRPCGLYGLRLLARDEILMVRGRLGRLRTWDFMRCDEISLLPGKPMPQNYYARKDEAEKDAKSMQRLLATLRLKDDSTSRGSANYYVLNLADSFEDLMCCKSLLELSNIEPGEHFDQPSWSEKAHLEERGTKWLIPSEWHSEIPQQGILSVKYFAERDGAKDEEARRALAVKYLGW